MKTNNTPANVATLLTAAAYVRTETIINGNQAAQLDAMVKQINDLAAKIEAVPAKIADLATQGKEKAVAMWERMAARYKAQFADAVANLRAWLVDFKANRPNVQINLDEPEDPETPNPDNTPATMNANEATTAPESSELSPAAKCLAIYLDNTREIYDRYTMPAIDKVAAMMRSNATHPQQFDATPEGVARLHEVKRALSVAAGLVRKCDHLNPTRADIEQAAHDYAAYIVECAQFENANA